MDRKLQDALGADSRSSKSKRDTTAKRIDFGSDGVTDNDILNLPTSDYKLLAAITLLTAIVRLFRIFQPTSVVFDEVQCVPLPGAHHDRMP
jgi:dolichyl-phosphate-mannose-protein mannosyltransferase